MQFFIAENGEKLKSATLKETVAIDEFWYDKRAFIELRGRIRVWLTHKVQFLKRCKPITLALLLHIGGCWLTCSTTQCRRKLLQMVDWDLYTAQWKLFRCRCLVASIKRKSASNVSKYIVFYPCNLGYIQDIYHYTGLKQFTKST